MPLKVKFGGPLVRFKPEHAKGNTATMDTNAELTLHQLIGDLGIPNEQRLFVILNGTVIPKDAYSTTFLVDNDDLSLMPPIQAG